MFYGVGSIIIAYKVTKCQQELLGFGEKKVEKEGFTQDIFRQRIAVDLGSRFLIFFSEIDPTMCTSDIAVYGSSTAEKQEPSAAMQI